MRKLIVSGILLLLVAGLRPASATTALPIQDGALADQAVVIAEGTVTGAGPSAQPGRPATEYRLRVERLIKGEAPGTLVVRVPGGAAANGLKLKIWGAPAFRIGERSLLFLVANQDGTYGPLHLALGAFHELRSGTERLAVRDLSEVYQAGAEETAEGVRNLDRFGRWLKDRVAGVEREADYFVAAPKMGRAWEEVNYLGGIKQRWREFDRKEDVIWRAHSAGQPQFGGGGFNEFQAALQAWNNEPSTNIRYRYQGLTNNTTGFQDFDGQNVILFDDLHDEAPGSFSCPRPGTGSGVLAIGGTWYDDSTTPATIGGADIVINNGAGCWFTTSKRAEQIYGHELGHTLGLGHACGDERTGPCNTNDKDDALMRATAHPDERGARFNANDRAAIVSLYPGADGPSNKPAAPSDLVGTATSRTQILLTWTDNSSNETQFLVQMKKNKNFKTVKTLKKNVTSVTINTGLKAGKSYTFRVLAKKQKVTSDASNTVTVQTLR